MIGFETVQEVEGVLMHLLHDQFIVALSVQKFIFG